MAIPQGRLPGAYGVLLCLLLLLSTCARGADIRDSVGALSTTGPQDGLYKLASDILHTMPRLDSGPNRLPEPVDFDAVITQNVQHPYVRGLLLSLGVSVVLMVLSLLACLNFCLGRCLCNSFGGRTATRTYSKTEVNCARYGMVVAWFSTLVLFGIGLAANSRISTAVDTSFVTARSSIDFVYGFRQPITSVYQTFDDGVAVLTRLSDTLRVGVTSKDELEDILACLDNVSSLTSQQKMLATSLEDLSNTTAKASFAPLATSLGDLEGNRTACPNLLQVEAEIYTAATALAGATIANVSQGVTALTNDIVPNSTTGAQGLSPRLAGAKNYLVGPVASGLSLQAQVADTVTKANSASGALSLTEGALSAMPSQAQITTVSNQLTAQVPTDPSGADATILKLWLDEEATMPAAGTLTTNLQALQASIASLNGLWGSGTILSDLTALVRSLPSLDLLGAGLTLVDGLDNAQVLKTATMSGESGTVLNAMPVVKLQSEINGAQTFKELLLDGRLDNLTNQLRVINATLESILCIEATLERIDGINSSMIDLPESIDKVYQQRDDISTQLENLPKVRADLEKGIKSIAQVQLSLDTLPNLTALSDSLSLLAESLEWLPDMTEVASGYESVHTAISALPDLQTIVTQLGALNATLPVFETMESFSAVLTSYSQALTALDVGSLITTSQALDTDRAALRPDVQLVHDASVAAQVFPASVDATTLANGLTRFRTYSDAPAASVSINSAVAQAPGSAAFTTLADELDSMAVASTPLESALPALNNSMTSLASGYSQSSSFTSRLSDTSKGATPLQITNFTLSQLPDLPALRTQTLEASAEMANQTDFVDTIDQLTSGGTASLTDQEKEDVRKSFDDVDVLQDILPSTASVIAIFQDASNAMRDIADNITALKRDMLVNTNRWEVNVKEWDSVRLAFFGIMLALPFLLTFLANCGCASGHNGPAMVMALSFFGLAAFFFGMAALQIVPAAFLADHCPVINQVIKSSLANVEINTTGIINQTHNTTAQEMFEYFSSCTGPIPTLIKILQNPAELIGVGEDSRAGFNSTEILRDIEGLAVKPELLEDLKGLDGMQGKLLDAARNFGEQLTCEKTAAVWQPFSTALCGDFAGALALSTCLYFLLACCLVPGICLGIKGYKRFDPKTRNFVDDESESDSDSGSDSDSDSGSSSESGSSSYSSDSRSSSSSSGSRSSSRSRSSSSLSDSDSDDMPKPAPKKGASRRQQSASSNRYDDEDG